MALNLIDLGKRIKQFRKKRGLSQAELAGQIYCASTYISYIESGQRCMSLETLVAIANTLHVSADEMLQDSLEKSIAVTNHEFAELLNDSSAIERKAMYVAATTAKSFLRENRGAIRADRR